VTVAAGLRRQVAAQARYRCGYCQTQEAVSGIPLTLEHIFPKARGGQDIEENLWLSCRLCNEAKGVQIDSVDPETETRVPLFNPRTDTWAVHFAWDVQDTHMIGLTPTGRATIAALSLNSELRVRARAVWAEAGHHPPADL
jgi:hypothetical protein